MARATARPERLEIAPQADACEDAYRIRPVARAAASPDGEYEAFHRESGMSVTFTESGLEVEPAGASWRWSMELSKYGRGSDLRPVADAELRARDNRMEYDRGELVEWYVNGAAGLEQGFTLLRPPHTHASVGATEPLVLELEVPDGFAVEADSGGVVFRAQVGFGALRYDHLVAWDATGRELAARLAYASNRVNIVVDDDGAVWPLTVDPLIVVEEARLKAGAPEAGDRFGNYVSLSGEYALIGAHEQNVARGSAYLFGRDGASWSQRARLLASDPTDYKRFGISVALLDDTALVGAVGDGEAGPGAGAAYVFVRNGTTWIQQAKLMASDAPISSSFGFTVALEEDTALVGAYRADFVRGAIYVFVRSGTTWSQQAKLVPADVADLDQFGVSLSLLGDTALIGANGDDDNGSNSGSAYVFARNGTSWTEQAKLTPSDGGPDNQFGFSVSLTEDGALIGAAWDDDNGARSGSAYVFVRDGTGWTEQAKLTASDGVTDDHFARSVSLSGNLALIGAPRADDGSRNSGKAYLFQRDGTAWSEVTRLHGTGVGQSDNYGRFVAMAGDTALIGADSWDSSAGSGTAFAFRLLSVGSYCTAKLNSRGCLPSIDFAGVPSATATSGFVVQVRNLLRGKAGLLLYGTAGPAATPFQGGVLCVASPVLRTPARPSSGVHPPQGCTGTLRIDMNEFAAGLAGGSPDPALRQLSTLVNSQWWSRDGQDPFGSSLSDALEYTVGP